MQHDWRAELRARVRRAEELEELGIPLQPELPQLLARLESEGRLPFAATGYYLSLAGKGPKDPILAQAIPDRREFERSPAELADPLGEAIHRVGSRLIHHYSSRVLIRATGECPVFCRHCFRRNLLPGERGFLSSKEMEAVAAYLASHGEVREVLVSGGDPLTADEGRLEELLGRIRAGRPRLVIRVCTRAPITLPSRVTPELLGLLRRFRPLRVVTQANHPQELAPAAREALGALVEAGIPVHDQTVLLRGVNDAVETLEELFASLLRLGVSPYYLFQGDLAAGTAHFRVPLSRGLALYAELGKRLSGLELPRYAVDAPGGGGKVQLPSGIGQFREGQWMLQTRDGVEVPYPEEE